MRLTDSLEEQELLEAVLEDSKPAVPAPVRRLHYLLATPYRYRPHLGSRFRAALEPGVWYGAEALRTALPGKSYWRRGVPLRAPRTPALNPGAPELKPVPHTAFRAAVRSRAALDLMRGPFVRERGAWTHRSDYQCTQEFAAVARTAHIELIRYESVRDPEHAACAAVLDPAA